MKLTRVLKANSKEWWLILIGMCASMAAGSIWPLFGIIFGQLLEVVAGPASEILSELHLYASLFIVIGIISFVSLFLKVSIQCAVIHICTYNSITET